MDYLTETELSKLGFAALGQYVQIDREATLVGVSRMQIGDHVNIDARALIYAGDGGLIIGKHVHVSMFAMITGSGPIELKDFCGLSSRVSIFSSNDDYLGESLTGPTVNSNLRKTSSAPVSIGRHCVIGAHTVILPGVTVHDGACVGALSLIKRDVPPLHIVGGNPPRFIRMRKPDFLELESQVH